MLLAYQEARAVISTMQNRNDMQKEIALIYHQGNLGKRECVFSFELINNNQAMCIMRAKKLPSHLNPKSSTTTYEKGECYRFSLLLSAVQRKKIIDKDGVYRTSYITPENLNDFTQDKIIKMGLINPVITKPLQLLPMSVITQKDDFILKVLSLSFKAEINDEILLKNSLIDGVGRNKGFGLGLLFMS